MALPCFAAFLLADAAFTATMTVYAALGPGWLSVGYETAYHVAAPCVLSLMVLAAVEAIGAVPRAEATSLTLGVILTGAATTNPTVTRLAILAATAMALIVTLTGRWSLHAALMLAFILPGSIQLLAILMGDVGSLRPGAFMAVAQIAPLVGWLMWVDRLAGTAGARTRALSS